MADRLSAAGAPNREADEAPRFVDLAELLCPRPAGPTRFVSAHHSINARGVIFGGQFLGQALMVASQGQAEGTVAHSLRVDFLRPGSAHDPLVYACRPLLNGRTMGIVQVLGTQGDRLVMQATVSFQRPQSGPVFQLPAPCVPDPLSLRPLTELLYLDAHRVSAGIQASLDDQTLDLRLCEPTSILFEQQERPSLRYWVRVRQALPDGPCLQQAALAYLSDYWFSLVALWPHRPNKVDGSWDVVSLNHTLWFHSDVRADDWLLVDANSPSSGISRGLTLGSVYRRDGTLVASVAQESLYRPAAPGTQPQGAA